MFPGLPSIGWTVAAVIAVAGLVFVPLELMAIAAGTFLARARGAAAALLGALAGAALGYIARKARSGRHGCHGG
jgi:hypothetical protein